jgi:hypothetical protein
VSLKIPDRAIVNHGLEASDKLFVCFDFPTFVGHDKVNVIHAF